MRSCFTEYLCKVAAWVLLAFFLTPCVAAQEIRQSPTKLIIPDGTSIKLRLAETVCSSRAHVGDVVHFIVVRDVSVGGFTVVRSGTMAQGSIIGVKASRVLGIGGKLSLRVDSVELVNGDRIGLRASKEVKGRSRTKLMIGGMIVTGLIYLPALPVFLLTRGHDSTAVESTEITAQVDGASSIPSAGLPHSPENPSELDAMMDYLPPRIFSGEGRRGDMLNLVLVAQQKELQEAFRLAGWVRTDKWKPLFVWHLIRHGTNDTRLPMARFYLFGRVQDYSYALPDPEAVVVRRHHLRIWKTDYTVDGTPVWAGAATHDVGIEIAKRGHLINHRIDPHVDAERDFIGANLMDRSSIIRKAYLRCVDPVFEAQTVSGEAYHSDSRMLLLDLHGVAPGKASVYDQSAYSER